MQGKSYAEITKISMLDMAFTTMFNRYSGACNRGFLGSGMVKALELIKTGYLLLASNLEIVVGCTLNNRAASAAVLLPEVTKRTISCF
jgi:hypothetical protein